MNCNRRVPASIMEDDLKQTDKLTFKVEWYDPQAEIIKTFLLTFYASDETVELYDCKNHRSFLRRTKVDGIVRENLYKTAVINIFSRHMKVVDYADAKTSAVYDQVLSRTFCMVKPDLADKVGEILTFMQDHRLKIIQLKMGTMTEDSAAEFYKQHVGQPHFPFLLKYITSGPCISMIAIGENAMTHWKGLIGPQDPVLAQKEAPNSLRAIYGTDVTKNGIHGSSTVQQVTQEMNIWFPSVKSHVMTVLPTCLLQNTTCAIIKPHAVTEGVVGPILNYMQSQGLKVTAMEMFHLDTPLCEEFFEVYKGVVPEYAAMVTHMTSGPCLAMEIFDPNSECTQDSFRKLVGPSDPDIARKLRPNTIRAKFGKTKVMNAVHCTDLPEDARLEVEYFFKILQ